MFKKVKKETVKPVHTDRPIGGEDKKPPLSGSGGADLQTVIDETISVDGIIQGEEDLILEGSMKGRVELEKHIFTVGQKGRFDGDVCARDVVVKGCLKGSINAIDNLRISENADFFGEAKSKTISIEGGALVKGVFEIARKPAAKTAETTKPTEAASPEANRQAAPSSFHSRKGN